MKLLYKYYKWRESRASEIDKTAWKLKAYRHSNIYRSNFGGRDITFEEYPLDVKAEQTLEPPLKHPERVLVEYDLWYQYGTEERKDFARHKENGEWVRTPIEWASDKEKNEAHMPWKRGERVPPRSEVWKWDDNEKKWVRRNGN